MTAVKHFSHYANGIWKRENFPQRWWLDSWLVSRSNINLTFYVIFYIMQIYLLGSLGIMKRGVINTTRKVNFRVCFRKQSAHLDQKGTYNSLLGQNHAGVFPGIYPTSHPTKMLHKAILLWGPRSNRDSYMVCGKQYLALSAFS